MLSIIQHAIASWESFSSRHQMDFQHCKCSNSRMCNSPLHKSTMNSPDGFLPLLLFMLLLFFIRNLLHKTTSNTIDFFCHHHLELCASKYVSSSLLLLASAPNGALKNVRLATQEVFVIFSALQALPSSLGIFQTSSSLLVSSPFCNILIRLL